MSLHSPLPGPDDTVTYTYTAEGLLETVTDPIGLRTRISAWNGRGQPTAATDPNGVMTVYAYDGLGRLTGIVIDPGPQEERWAMAYTAAGDLETVSEPAGRTLAFTWDGARRLVGIANNGGEHVTYERDALGGITRRTQAGADGRIVFEETGAFDELGRLIRQVGGEARAWAFTYDRTDKLTGLTDPRGHTIGRGYDGLGRLLSELERDGGRVVHGYNRRGEATSYADPGGLTTAYVRNGFGEVIQEVSPDRGTSVFDYDERGLVIRKVDGRGIESVYAYDAAGRPVARRASDGSLVSWSYDDSRYGNAGRGRLTGMADAAGTSAYAYDAKGRVVRETRDIAGAVSTIGSGYDGAGRLERLIYPSGRTVLYGYDGLGRVNAIGLQRSAGGPVEELLSGVEYLPEGPLRRAVFGNGMVLARAYDREYRIAALSVTRADGSRVTERGYTVGDGLNLTEIATDGEGGHDVLSLRYDPAQRLAMAGRIGERWAWSYDATGNRLAEEHTNLSGLTRRAYSYGPGTNRLAAIVRDGAVERRFAYDGAGNLAQEDRGAALAYEYDGSGQLAQVRLGRLAPVRARYTYDGRHRLAIRELVNGVPDGTIHLVYDGEDRLIAETDAAGVTLKEYVWLGELPVAVLDGTSDPAHPGLLFVQADHLARPVLLADAAGAVVWRATYDPFGAVAEIVGPASLDLRFPGQWFQLETGLAYNWHRHYDPTTGRYITPDPLGLHRDPQPPGPASSGGTVGESFRSWLQELGLQARPVPDQGSRVPRDGPSLYAYAHSDPLQRTDLKGLLSPGPMTPRPPRDSLVQRCLMDPSSDRCASILRGCKQGCGEAFADGVVRGLTGLRQCIRECMLSHGCLY
ncbi:RHS repeat-associated core domain-containing protein [Microvirga sp. M2]|uniref:RHS repeat-associated core domain-containing protein n=1 Tax=Microvirga sp. M2 TaxID=3073270 RepID=UPI0039C184FC